MNQQKSKERKDIEELNNNHPLLDIVEVAYDKDGKVFAFAVRDIPLPIKINTNIFNNMPMCGS